MIEEKVLKEIAEKRLICFNEQYPKREHCLLWMVEQYVPNGQMTVTDINPNYSLCPYCLSWHAQGRTTDNY